MGLAILPIVMTCRVRLKPRQSDPKGSPYILSLRGTKPQSNLKEIPIKIKTLTILLALLLWLLPVKPVAAASITLSPGTGPVGTAVAVTGSGFNGVNFRVTYDGAEVARGTIFGGTVVTAFTIPTSTKGLHTVAVTDDATPPVTAQATFKVTPSISLHPTTGAVGTTVTVSGKGFTATEPDIKITYDGTEQKTGITADGFGSWTATFTVPASAKGEHKVVGFSTTTLEIEVPARSFTVTPKISLSPTSGGVQTSVTVTGTGFGKDETGIRVTFAGTAVKTGITADDKGSFTTTFIVPTAIRGDHIVDAMGTTTAAEVPDVVFTIAPRIKVEPTSAPVWSTITVTGSGFAGNEKNIRLLYDGNVVKSDITADATGSWTITLQVPPGAWGTHTIDASGPITPDTEIPDLTFTVLSAIKVDPISVAVGTAVTVTGSGFAKNSGITVTYNTTELATGTISDATGSFTATFKAPKSKGGAHKIGIKDAAGNSVTASVTMETTPPPAPTLGSPPPGARVSFLGRATPQFTWSAVTDPSGVSYTLEIAQSEDFTAIRLRKVNLTETSYKLKGEEALGYGTYHWRLKAIDNADNESPWTESQSFRVGLMPTWLFIVVVLGGAVLIAAIIFRLRQVLKQMDWE